jgi:hypothetical protein
MVIAVLVLTAVIVGLCLLARKFGWNSGPVPELEQTGDGYVRVATRKA